jgi:HK97 family phage prohead protease
MSDKTAIFTPKTPEKLVCFFARGDSEVFASEPGQPARIRGYAAKFDRFSHDLGGYRVKIARGAFTDVLATSDARCLVNHDANLLLGRQSSGTLRLFGDDVGLGYECDPPESQMTEHYLACIRRGDMDGCSFSCYIDIDQWDFSGETPIRTIEHVSELLDVGPVTFPAFPDTSVVSHSLEAARRASAASPRQSSEMLRLRLELAR